ncbi:MULTISPECIES: hypothetical protein [Catenuloplanes]|uniref:Uncharacterized protein n=1 Tax=Catenuloplanes niger TaxID=587534 RepID=A0AAE4A034_9ACTN|nr:hypothetical protein [Catenuloplanes niger]MDR7328202.1 hypothetical protein [Catenuloplanes niger]
MRTGSPGPPGQPGGGVREVSGPERERRAVQRPDREATEAVDAPGAYR